MRYYRSILTCLLAAGFALIPIVSVQARVIPIELNKLVHISDYIVLARVESVNAKDGIRIARAVPQQEFKSSNKGRPIYFIAEPTWTCDTSTAVPGETVLLFLVRLPGQTVERMAKPTVRVGVKPLFRIAHSGRGRMPLSSMDGTPYARMLTGDVILPAQITCVPDPATPDNGVRRAARLSDLVLHISKPQVAANNK